MTTVLILGAGKIGRMIAAFLSRTSGYDVQVADVDADAADVLAQRFSVPARAVDAGDRDELRGVVAGADIVISALSFRFNTLVAQVALETGASYFDLTEDVETTRSVRQIARSAQDGQVFMPQCGLAPGFVSIVAKHLTTGFDALDSVLMRVGALPQFPSNALKYNLTWSTDGLINEYCNPCESIHEGRRIEVLPLEGLEHFSLDGVRYEAFNTSGGLGTLCETLEGQTRQLNYKTIRYLGHRDLMTVLVNDLRLGQRREQFKDILEAAIPVTYQDVVVVFCTVSGQRDGQFTQITDARRIYHEELDGEHWAAIQITTAAGVCAVVDLFVEGKLPRKGFVKQEQVGFEDFIANRFGRYYDISGKTGLARQIS